MCGSLRREKLNERFGHPEPSYTKGSNVPVCGQDGSQFEAFWNGHARCETLQELFLNKGWKIGKLDVTHYTEGHAGQRKMYSVPTGKGIKVIYREVPGKGNIFNIVTRPARGAELEVHPRFPICE